MKKQLLTLLLVVPGLSLLSRAYSPGISTRQAETTKNILNLNQKKMEDTMTNDNQKAWDIYKKYLEGWKPVSKKEREKIASQVMGENIAYTTPRHDSGNRSTAIEDMEAFQEKFPGGHFEARDVSAHHDVALLTWDLIQANGESLAKGHDQIRISKEGKIIGLTTFAPAVSKP